MNCSVILLAAGKGTRYKGTKQDVLFHDKPLWRYAYETAASIVGKERMVEDTARVVIVEAARPMVTREQIQMLLDDPHPSVSFVRPLVNTVVYRNGTYINREDLFDLLTPQAFDYQVIMELHERAIAENCLGAWDNSSMITKLGEKVYFSEGSDVNIKINTVEDVAMFKALYKMKNTEEPIDARR